MLAPTSPPAGSSAKTTPPPRPTPEASAPTLAPPTPAADTGGRGNDAPSTPESPPPPKPPPPSSPEPDDRPAPAQTTPAGPARAAYAGNRAAWLPGPRPRAPPRCN